MPAPSAPLPDPTTCSSNIVLPHRLSSGAIEPCRRGDGGALGKAVGTELLWLRKSNQRAVHGMGDGATIPPAHPIMRLSTPPQDRLLLIRAASRMKLPIKLAHVTIVEAAM